MSWNSGMIAEAAEFIRQDNAANRLWAVESVRTLRNGTKLREQHIIPGHSEDEARAALGNASYREIVRVDAMGHVMLHSAVAEDNGTE